MNKKMYVELSSSDMSGYDTDLTMFFGGRYLFFEVRDIEDFMNNIQKYFPEVKPLCNDTFYQYIESMENKKRILIKLVKNCNYELSRKELESITYNELKVLLNELYGEVDLKLLVDVYDYYDFVQEYIKYLGYKTGTVGYSDWSYYITIEGEDFVTDLYEGYNFYDTALLDENGEVLDSVGWIYAPNELDLIDVIKCEYGIDEKNIILVDNDKSRYFNLPKAKMEVASYKFTMI